MPSSFFDENCPLCRDQARGTSWVRLILNNQRTVYECAAFYRVTEKYVEEHIYEHFNTELDVTPDDPDYVKKKMLKFITVIELWFDNMVTTSGVNIDRATIEMGLKMIREIRDSLKVVGEIDGKLNRTDPAIQIINMKNDLKQLTNVIMMDMCPDCQTKALKAMEQLQLPAKT